MHSIASLSLYFRSWRS